MTDERRTKTIPLYQFSELSDSAKAHALEKIRHWHVEGSYWYEFIKDEFEGAILPAMGFRDVTSQFSGFWNQGDGASFDFKKLDVDLLINPQDIDAADFKKEHDEWLSRNRMLIAKIRRLPKDTIWGESARTSYGHRYSHEKTRFAVLGLQEYTRDLPCIEKLIADFEATVTDLTENLSHTYYATLEREYDYLTGDDFLTEYMNDLGYDFDINGDIQ